MLKVFFFSLTEKGVKLAGKTMRRKEKAIMWKRTLKHGIISGLLMAIGLFISGAVFSRIIYGPQFVPAGKFRPEQINAFYFLWTKILIGIFFGFLFTLYYERLPLRKRLTGPLQGLKYGFFLWFLVSLWNLSHPLIYGSIQYNDQLFWLLYSLGGFSAFGVTLGILYKKNETD